VAVKHEMFIETAMHKRLAKPNHRRQKVSLLSELVRLEIQI